MPEKNLNASLSDIQALLEATKEQARAEKERIDLENSKLEEEKKRRIAEEQRVQQLQTIVDKLDCISNLLYNTLNPNTEKMLQQNTIMLEILKILATLKHENLESTSPHSESELKNILFKVLDTLPNFSGKAANINVSAGTTFKAEDDLNIMADEQKIGA